MWTPEFNTSKMPRTGIPQAAFQHVSTCLKKHKMEQASSCHSIVSHQNREQNLRTRTIYLTLGYVQSAREINTQAELIQPVFLGIFVTFVLTNLLLSNFYTMLLLYTMLLTTVVTIILMLIL